jgi:hypothetical protein
VKLKNTKDWHQEPKLEKLLFLAQRLDELYFDYTLDTYKPPALNSVHLCREAIELIEDIEDDLIDRNNLAYVLEELEWSLSSDIVAKMILEAPFQKFILKGESVKLSEIKVRLEVLERVLNPLKYIEGCQILLKIEIESGSKKKIDSILRTYTSSLINHGISKQHLYEKTQEFFFYGKELTNIEELDEYFYLVSPTIHHFEIYFVVSDLINDVKESIPTFDLNILDELPDTVSPLAKKEKIILEENEVWVEVLDIEAFDRHTARMKAESKLDMVRDLFLLFSHKNRIEWRGDSIITQCCDETPILIRKPKNSMEKCFDLRSKEAALRLNRMIKSINLEGKNFTKFHRAVDLHALGSANDLPENQLLNIWIALETLVPSHVSGGGKVVKIVNGIMPILLKNYLKRLVERLTGDLVRWNRAKISKILRKIPDSKGKSLYLKVLELITVSTHKELLSELYSELDNFYLLKNRVFELTDLFKKPENLIKKIELHEKKVSWQIRRIYRTRNLIVHSGRSLEYIDTLIENAHDYLDQTMNTIIEYSCGMLDVYSLEQAFDMAKIEYEVYISEIKNLSTIDGSNFDRLVQ